MICFYSASLEIWEELCLCLYRKTKRRVIISKYVGISSVSIHLLQLRILQQGYSIYEIQVWTVLFKFDTYSKSNLILKLRITCRCQTWKPPWTTSLVFEIKCHKENWYLMQHFHTYSYSSLMCNWTNYFTRGTMSPPKIPNCQEH